MTRRTSLNFMAFVRALDLALAAFLKPEIEFVSAPDDQDDRPETPDLVEDVDVELLKQEYRADDDEDDAPDERIASFLLGHRKPPLSAVLRAAQGIEHELEPDDDDRDRPEVEQRVVADDFEIGHDEHD